MDVIYIINNKAFFSLIFALNIVKRILARGYKIKVHKYSVFCHSQYQGNPAGVVELTVWPTDDSILLETAQNAKLPVTSFFVSNEESYEVRWFSQQSEINLCGHGSLAIAAYIHETKNVDLIRLTSQHGDLTITPIGGSCFEMEMPVWSGTSAPKQIFTALELPVIEAFTTRDCVLVLASKQDVADFNPDFEWIKNNIEQHALIVTAADGDAGYVVRYFAPRIGIDEDIATGSAQCSLAPYWFEKLAANKLKVTQLSSVGGYMSVEAKTNQVFRLQADVQRETVSEVNN